MSSSDGRIFDMEESSGPSSPGSSAPNTPPIPVVREPEPESEQEADKLAIAAPSVRPPAAPPPSPARRPSLQHPLGQQSLGQVHQGHLHNSSSTSGFLPSQHPHDLLHQVEVIDDLSVNRWLMRIMRLGGQMQQQQQQSGRYGCATGSSGYGAQALNVSNPAALRGRRKSAVEANSFGMSAAAAAAGGGGGAFLRPPPTVRGRRFSDSLNLFTTGGRGSPCGGSRSSSRKGKREGRRQSALKADA